MKIPKRFKLFGQTIEVIQSSDYEDKEGSQGAAQFNKNRIIIQCNKALKRPGTRMEQCYIHEMVHMIFNELHYPKETYNEQMVDQIASALHQVLTTSEYK
jgi:hypothetical protein|tara:strand:+ start:2744 stop:3043 length:300 start_codon:yes stop_codon:yes gene_type:complete